MDRQTERYTNVHIYIYPHMNINIHICRMYAYIYREREKEKERRAHCYGEMPCDRHLTVQPTPEAKVLRNAGRGLKQNVKWSLHPDYNTVICM